MSTLSFTSAVPVGAAAEDHLLAYEQVLAARNGTLAVNDGFERREEMMDDSQASTT